MKGGLDGAAASQGGEVGSRTGAGREGSVPEKRGDERVIATHFNTLFKPLASSRFLPEQRDTPTSPLWCHSSYLPFQMGFCLCDSEPQAVPVSDELPHLNTHLPSSKNIPPTRDYRAKVV